MVCFDWKICEFMRFNHFLIYLFLFAENLTNSKAWWEVATNWMMTPNLYNEKSCEEVSSGSNYFCCCCCCCGQLHQFENGNGIKYGYLISVITNSLIIPNQSCSYFWSYMIWITKKSGSKHMFYNRLTVCVPGNILQMDCVNP